MAVTDPGVGETGPGSLVDLSSGLRVLSVVGEGDEVGINRLVFVTTGPKSRRC